MTFDVAVAGGGPAGAATALVLARAGRRVLLADAGRGASSGGAGESLPGAASQVLRDLGLWEAFRAEPHLVSYGGRSAWGTSEVLRRHAVFDPYGSGRLLDRARFDAFLRAGAAAAGATVVSARVDLPRASWVVDATGRAATVARSFGARRVEDDHLVAAVARYAAADDPDTTTLVESVPGGWWYTARVPDGTRAVAFLTDADLLPPVAGLDAAVRATRQVGACVTGPLLGPPRVVSARGGRLAPYAGDGWLATGDAALSCDPLSSQGVLTALVTGVAAGEALVAALDGDSSAIDSYAARLDAIRAAYERNRDDYYALERRWPEAPFWARRRALAAVQVRSVVQAPGGGGHLAESAQRAGGWRA